MKTGKKVFKEHHPKIFEYIKKYRTHLNTFSIAMNVFFVGIVLFEFFTPSDISFRNIQIVLGVIFLIELYLRMKYHGFKSSYVFSWLNIIDMMVIMLIFIRFYYIDNAILHILTALKIFRSYRVIHELSKVNQYISDKQEVIFSVINLCIFTFFMASIVFTMQYQHNPDIDTFLDALYFTITTLTTTGFGDILMIGEYGKLLVILIMTLGTGLFLRLLTVIFRPTKSYYHCKHCGLTRHDRDASHCKHC
ncbi:MAG: potassium channel family protein [Candidatus Peribacteria bacterium]|nr:MAG: potassium channel family protein [Candidatus Peribacteria bacterium]